MEFNYELNFLCIKQSWWCLFYIKLWSKLNKIQYVKNFRDCMIFCKGYYKIEINYFFSWRNNFKEMNLEFDFYQRLVVSRQMKVMI